jgi:hypothetical protein
VAIALEAQTEKVVVARLDDLAVDRELDQVARFLNRPHQRRHVHHVEHDRDDALLVLGAQFLRIGARLRLGLDLEEVVVHHADEDDRREAVLRHRVRHRDGVDIERLQVGDGDPADKAGNHQKRQ